MKNGGLKVHASSLLSYVQKVGGIIYLEKEQSQRVSLFHVCSCVKYIQMSHSIPIGGSCSPPPSPKLKCLETSCPTLNRLRGRSIGFTPFQLVYGLEDTLPIEFKIPSPKLVVEFLPNTTSEEEHLIYLNKLDETCRDASLENEMHKQQIKSPYDRSVQPFPFNKGHLVLT